MSASKEQAREALEALKKWPGACSEKFEVAEFIQSAIASLPWRQTIDKHRIRRLGRSRRKGGAE